MVNGAREIVCIRDDLSGVPRLVSVTNRLGVVSNSLTYGSRSDYFFTASKIYELGNGARIFTEYGIGSNPGNSPISLPDELPTTPARLYKNGDIVYVLYDKTPSGISRAMYDIRAMRFSTSR